MITQKQLLDIFEYRNGELYWKKSRRTDKIGVRAGYVETSPTRKGYVCIGVKSKLYQEHRLIWQMFNGDNMPAMLDHINGNPTDNRIENLRIATHEQNMRNAKKSKNNTSGIKGVSWYKRDKKWQVKLCISRKQLSFGLFKDKELAELVAIEARDKYHKEFARHK